MFARLALLTFCAITLAASALAQPTQPAPLPPPMPPASATAPPGGTPQTSATMPPPMPPYVVGEPDAEPQITIIRREAETVEEVRVNGDLRYVKVTPRIGPPYYLVPNSNGQSFLRYDSLDFGLKPPMWLLFSW